jgi:ApeA N-terminal domain 1
MSVTDLHQKFEIRGHWWLPGTPNKKVSGTLSFDPKDGLTLKYMGHISHDPAPGVVIEDHFEFIHGRSIDNLDVTLHHCRMGKLSRHMGEGCYDADGLFLGKLFDSEEALKFNTVTLTFPALSFWIGQTPFERLKRDGEFATIKYKTVEHFRFELPSIGATISSRNWTTQGASAAGGWEESIRATPYLSLSFKEPLSHGKIFRKIVQLEHLFCLMLGRAVYSRRIFLDRNSEELEIPPQSKSVEFAYSYRRFDGEPERNGADSLFRMGDFTKVDLQSLFDNWFSFYDEISPACSLFFAGTYKSDMYAEYQFLSLAQAIETYHRIVHGGTFMADEAYAKFSEAMKTAIPVDVPEDMKQSFDNAFKYGNQISLRRRLREMIKELPEELRSLFPDKEKVMVDAIVDLRNNLTHVDKKTPPFDGSKGVRAAAALKILLTVSILMRLKIKPSLIRTAIDNGYRWALQSKEKRGTITEI